MRKWFFLALLICVSSAPPRAASLAATAPVECEGCQASGGGWMVHSDASSGCTVTITVTPASGACVPYDGECAPSACTAAVARGWSGPNGTEVKQCEVQNYSSGYSQSYCMQPHVVIGPDAPNTSSVQRRIGCGNNTSFEIAAGGASASINVACSSCGH